MQDTVHEHERSNTGEWATPEAAEYYIKRYLQRIAASHIRDFASTINEEIVEHANRVIKNHRNFDIESYLNTLLIEHDLVEMAKAVVEVSSKVTLQQATRSTLKKEINMVAQKFKDAFTVDFWTNEENPPSIEYTFDEQGKGKELCPMLQSVKLLYSTYDKDKNFTQVQLDTCRELITISENGKLTKFNVEDQVKDPNFCYTVLEHYEQRFGDIY